MHASDRLAHLISLSPGMVGKNLLQLELVQGLCVHVRCVTGYEPQKQIQNCHRILPAD
jgi:hypothetical protein